MHEGDALSKDQCFAYVVGYKNRSFIKTRSQLSEFTLQGCSRKWIKSSEWFIQQKQWRIRAQSTCDTGTLSLAS
jgi:hypothetical protein